MEGKDLLQLIHLEYGGLGKNSTVMDNFRSKHAQNSQHGKTSVTDFDAEGPNLSGRLIVQGESEVSCSKVTRFSALTLLDEHFVRTNHHGHLAPTCQRNCRQGGQTIGHVFKLEIGRWTQKPLEMVVLLGEHTESGSHGNATVFDFDRAVVEKVIFWGSVWAIFDESQRAVWKRGKGV